MKTAVSIPDDIYADAERTARQLGIPRSQLVARALEEFIRNHERDRLTKKLDAVYGSDDEIAEHAVSEAEVSIESLRELTRDDAW
jgi:metal-responsive CopG/Arc/MetJ family transcriptional regulator